MDGTGKRVFYLVIDQMAGHWAGGVTVSDNLPPVNIKGYHELGLIPTFSHLIDSGIWVREPWNRGICNTPNGMRYLATGSYGSLDKDAIGGNQGQKRVVDRPETPVGFFEYVTENYPDQVNTAVFTTAAWIRAGYFHSTQYVNGLPGFHPDDSMWYDFALPWLKQNPNWNLVHVYFPTFDTILCCPSYWRQSPHIKANKHAYILHLDGLLDSIVGYLKHKHIWDETYLVVASDHGYHLGCDAAVRGGAPLRNWCEDHYAPYDCMVWDFEQGKPTDMYSGGPRRTTFFISGGAVPKAWRGCTIDTAEIIDVIPTIAEMMQVDYHCEGRSILGQLP